jgi:hypothetical protein
LPWLVVGVGELAVAVCGDSAAGVAVAAGPAGVGQVAQGLVTPLADRHRGGLSVSLRESVTELAGFVAGLAGGGYPVSGKGRWQVWQAPVMTASSSCSSRSTA